VKALGGALALALALCAEAALAQARDWAFIQSVGGLALGTPRQRSGGWQLPIRCDVSGVEAVTQQPTAMNSSLICITEARVEGQTILLTVLTRPDTDGAFSACRPARLGQPPKGRYEVFYAGSASERVPLGEVYIPR
jgi:hypothetical protein